MASFLDLVLEKFQLPPSDDLIKYDEKSLNITIKSGKQWSILGSTILYNRTISIRFSFEQGISFFIVADGIQFAFPLISSF